MYCIKCGKKLDEGNRFCTNCGQPVDNKNNTYIKQTVQVKRKEQTSGTAIASLVIGIISFAISFIFSLISLPLSIAGFCFGIATKQKSGIKIAGLILNILAALISILMLIIFGTMILSSMLKIINMERPSFNYYKDAPIVGEWDCKAFDGAGEHGNYLFTLKLQDDNSFIWYKFDDRFNNNIDGTYTYEDLKKSTNDNKYKYYNINLKSENYVENGVKTTKTYNTTYEMGVNEDEDQAILMNVNSYNMYYCYR